MKLKNINITMANIKYKGLSGLERTLVVQDSNTFSEITALIISDETLASNYYADFVLERNISIKESTHGDSTYTQLSLSDDDRIIAIANDNDEDKATRATKKINIATLKRQGGPDSNTSAPYYRSHNQYNPTTKRWDESG